MTVYPPILPDPSIHLFSVFGFACVLLPLVCCVLRRLFVFRRANKAKVVCWA